MITNNSSAPVQYRVDFRNEFAFIGRVEPEEARETLRAVATGATAGGGTYGALITGPVGAGKTYAMNAARREVPAALGDVVWVDWPEFIDDVYEHERRGKGGRATSDHHRFEPLAYLLRVDACVFLDDVGAERDQFGIAIAAFQRVVAGRCKMPRLLFVTTNLAPGALADRYGERTESRLLQHVVHVEVPGHDRRMVTP